MQTEKSQPEGERIIPETNNAGKEVYLISGIIHLPSGWDFSDCIGDHVKLFFLPMTLKIIIYYPSFLSFLDILLCIMTFSEHHSLLFTEEQK